MNHVKFAFAKSILRNFNNNSLMFIGNTRFFRAEMDSTNAYLQRLLQKKFLPEGSVVSTEHQTNGRGQMGTIWDSGMGTDITLSLLLYPTFLNISEQFMLSEAMALGVLKALADILPTHKLAIKWPNDILVGTEKICGILIENAIQGSQIRNSIIGIGINVNKDLSNQSLRTSLKTQSGKEYPIQELEQKLFSWLEHYYLLLRSGKQAELHQEYINRLYGFNESLFYKKNSSDELFTGVIKGVSMNGRLNMLVDDKMLAFDLKEIKFLFPDEAPNY